MGVMGGVAAPQGPVVGVRGFGQHLYPSSTPSHCGVRTVVGNGPANLFKVLLSSLLGSWRIPKANLPLSRAGHSSAQGHLGEVESEGWQSGWLLKLRDREKVSGVTKNISCLCPPFPSPDPPD